ncbi:nitroreductase/quinone reductase family protein [Actinoplanes sp. NPDC051346]|uniref:nitroreductase/quinone reductase family protein n=1 Tax=Actinoplanes sp. NPDC051346 TaxID=3155048 RepID=UPI0034169EA7
MTGERIVDSPHPWVAEHIRRFEQTGGTIQVRDQTLAARARTATARERPRLWRLLTAMSPSYREYQRATAREIPVVVIEPRSRSA